MKGVLQHDLRDCGPACLATILHFNGINVPLREIRELMHVNKQGASIFSICSAAKSYGFIACGYKISTGELFDVERNSRITFPCIVHTAKNNFMQGLNCCQSVFAAFRDLTGLDEKTALKLSAPLGGGVGRMRELCDFFT